MKKIVFTVMASVALLYSCKKNKVAPSYASINIINASIGAGTIKVNYFGKSVNWSSFIGSSGLVNFGTNQILTGFNINADYPLTIVPALDTLNAVFKQKLDFEASGNYTLFTTGQTGAYDAVFVKEETIPYNYADSAIAIRFINLSPNSPAVNVTLASTPTINETSGLAYKQKTAFKKYADLKVVPTGSLTFQVRDAVSNAILTTYAIPVTGASPYTTVSTSLSRFKSITLAIKGLAGTASGTNAYSVFPVPQY
jgi:hypothetical protein